MNERRKVVVYHPNQNHLYHCRLPRLVTSHPDYPLDEDTFINRVDIWWKVRRRMTRSRS